MPSAVPDAELLLAPGCVHCPVVLAALTDELKRGRLGRVDVVSIVAHPELAAERGVRGVPWFRIGPFELSGAHTPAEITTWITRAGSDEGMRHYLSDSLASGQLDAVISACRRSPALLLPLLDLAADLDTPYAVRIGVGAVVEELAPDGLPATAMERLLAMADDTQPQVRADAAHFLGLAASDAARERLQRLLEDPDHEVREIAAESLAASD
ncbi:MAG: HEAT repeat domain-containing protein [Gammaproteobacteria bacterium]|nr:HEAT repeat domain-containing protein [Gammaproteobacteria bacterium]